MQTTGKLFDDLARVAGGAAGALHGIRDEVEGLVKARLERVLADMDLVTREEFEAMKAVAIKAREEQERLAKELDALKAGVGAETTGAEATGAEAANAKPSVKRKARPTKKAPAQAPAKTSE